MDRSVIEALQAALTADPENGAIRSHLAELLLAAGDGQQALAVARDGLVRSPADSALLTVAAAAAEQIGADQEAAGYRTLLAALGHPGAGAPPSTDEPLESAPPPQDEPPQGAAPAADLDRAEPIAAIPETADDLIQRWGESGDAPEEDLVHGDMTRPALRLADVAGMVDVKERLDLAFLAPMRNPELRIAFGKSLRGSMLMWGPPGCGKTFLARAVAGELGASFYHVGLSEVLDMWFGQTEKNVHSIFEAARRNAPCVLFLDEVDALGQKRSQNRNSAGRNVVNQLLTELDGVDDINEGVFLLAASNHPWDIDSALLRPGRIDQKLLVLPPDAEARAAIFEYHLRDRPVDAVDTAKLASVTDGFSGADIAAVCERATEWAMVDSIKSGSVRNVSDKDLRRAVKAVSPSNGPWFQTAKNYALFANESGEFDDLLNYMKQRRI